MKTKYNILSYFVLIIVIVIIILFGFLFPELKQILTPEFIRVFVLSFGFFAFIIYIILVSLAVPFNIPSTPIILAGGYIFGTISGFVLSLLGMIIGSTLAFYITRIGGKPLLEKLVDSHHISHFMKIFEKRGATAALLSYAVPVFPTDAVSLFLGLTNIRYRLFITLVLFGHIPRILIIILLGSDIHSGFSYRTIIVLIIALIYILIIVFREKIKKIIFNELGIFSKEMKLIESWFGGK